MDSIIYAWIVVFIAGISVVFLYVRQDRSYFDTVKDQMAILSAQNKSLQMQAKEDRESMEKLRTQFQDFYKMKTEADMVLCSIKDIMAKELEFNRGALQGFKSKLDKVDENYDRTRDQIRQLDHTCSNLIGKQQPVKLGPITVELKTETKKPLGRGLDAILDRQGVKTPKKKSK